MAKIYWESKITNAQRTWHRRFSLEHAKKIAEELNKEIPEYHHWANNYNKKYLFFSLIY